MTIPAPDPPSVICTLKDELTLTPGFIAALYREDEWSADARRFLRDLSEPLRGFDAGEQQS